MTMVAECSSSMEPLNEGFHGDGSRVQQLYGTLIKVAMAMAAEGQ